MCNHCNASSKPVVRYESVLNSAGKYHIFFATLSSLRSSRGHASVGGSVHAGVPIVQRQAPGRWTAVQTSRSKPKGHFGCPERRVFPVMRTVHFPVLASHSSNSCLLPCTAQAWITVRAHVVKNGNARAAGSSSNHGANDCMWNSLRKCGYDGASGS